MLRHKPHSANKTKTRRFRPNRTAVTVLTAGEFDEMVEEQLLQYADAVDAFAKGDETGDPTTYAALECHFHLAHDELVTFIKRLARIA